MKNYPFLSASQAAVILRVSTAILFMAHAIMRIVNGTIPQFGNFMSALGFPFGEAVVWLITVVEIVAGMLLIWNCYVRIAATGLFAIAVVGIALIHRHLGWFVGEHGTGGSEYSVALMVMLLVIATNDPQLDARAAQGHRRDDRTMADDSHVPQTDDVNKERTPK